MLKLIYQENNHQAQTEGIKTIHCWEMTPSLLFDDTSLFSLKSTVIQHVEIKWLMNHGISYVKPSKKIIVNRRPEKPEEQWEGII